MVGMIFLLSAGLAYRERGMGIAPEYQALTQIYAAKQTK
jgi:hypothetical protein